jgi:Xaa-Pro aminopeptidase
VTTPDGTLELTEDQRETHALVAEKHAQARSLLREQGIDCWLTFSREGSDLLLPYVMGGEELVGQAALMLFADGPSVAIVADYDASQVQGLFDIVIPYSTGWIAPFQETLRDRNPARIAINYSEVEHAVDGLTYGLYLRLVRVLEPIGMADRLVSSHPVTELVRSLKTPSEIERLRRACEITMRIFDDFTGMLKPGITEQDGWEIFVEQMRAYGVGPSWEAAYCPSVHSNRRPAGHTPPGAAQMLAGEAVHVDFGVKYEGYAADLQRVWYLRRPGESGPPVDVQRAFDAMKDGIVLALDIIKPGMKGYEIDEPVRELVRQRGFTYTHALGHQIGRLAHDGGVLMGPRNERYGDRTGGELRPGMVFTLEPCVANIGLEENLVITETGCELLVPAATEIILI